MGIIGRNIFLFGFEDYGATMVDFLCLNIFLNIFPRSNTYLGKL
jgi:hypothetical protein